MNTIKRAGLSTILALSSTFFPGCPPYSPSPSPTPSPTPTPTPTTEVEGRIDNNNEHHPANFEIDNTEYDFYFNNQGSSGVVINDKDNWDYYLGLFQDPLGNPSYVQHPEGSAVKVEYFDEDKAGISIYHSKIDYSKDLEIPKHYITNPKKNLEKTTSEDICDSIHDITKNKKLLSNFAGLISLSGCVASIVGDTATFPSGEALLGCAASYTHSRDLTEKLVDGAEKISEATLGCDFSISSLNDTSPSEMPQEPISGTGLPTINWIYNPDNNHQYTIGSPGNWQQAQREAKNLGGYLAVINNSEENQWLLNTFADTDNGYPSFWIGYSDLGTGGIWEWVNNSSSGYQNWEFGEPSNNSQENCAVWQNLYSYSEGKWKSVDCDIERPGLIERDTI